jgi:hypothetical protein
MPRYLIERTFQDGVGLPPTDAGKATCQAVVKGNSGFGVTWLHSYVRDDGAKTYCVYDGPDAESIRAAAETNGLPIDRITRVNVLDPYFHQG